MGKIRWKGGKTWIRVEDKPAVKEEAAEESKQIAQLEDTNRQLQDKIKEFEGKETSAEMPAASDDGKDKIIKDQEAEISRLTKEAENHGDKEKLIEKLELEKGELTREIERL